MIVLFRILKRNSFLILGFTPCKVEQLLQSMELKESKENQDESHTKKLIKKPPKIAGAC